mgnify:CR=1 FL=1
MTKYCLVSDDSGHDYVIPADKRNDWYKFDFSDYDFDLPGWAIMVGGGLEFENPTEDGKPLFGTPKVQIVETDLIIQRPSSALDMDWAENLNTK